MDYNVQAVNPSVQRVQSVNSVAHLIECRNWVRDAEAVLVHVILGRYRVLVKHFVVTLVVPDEDADSRPPVGQPAPSLRYKPASVRGKLIDYLTHAWPRSVELRLLSRQLFWNHPAR